MSGTPLGGALLTVVASHEGVVVVDKPAGLPSTGRTLADPDCVQGRLMAQLGRRKVWAVHQLDAGTTGLNVFVLQKALVEAVGEAMKPPRGRKRYLAVVRGAFEATERRIDLPIGDVPGEGGRPIPGVSRQGRPASSLVRLVSAGAEASLVEVQLLTGRTHQVRVHLAAVGHPLVGETLHAPPGGPAFSRPALHAWRLELDLPPPLARLEAPLPADLRALLAALALEAP